MAKAASVWNDSSSIPLDDRRSPRTICNRLVPNIHRDMKPGNAMTFHISFGTVILALMTLRFFGRLTHLAPEASIPPWQHLTSLGVHWLLFVLVLATTITGWAFASFRGWSISWFFIAPLPMLAHEASAANRASTCTLQVSGAANPDAHIMQQPIPSSRSAFFFWSSLNAP